MRDAGHLDTTIVVTTHPRTRRIRSCAWALGALLATAVTPAVAQRGTGVVRDSSTSAPLPGAVVSALDSLRRSLARTVSDASGRYSIELSDGATQLRVQRIGFQPRVVPLPKRRDALFSMDLWLKKLPTLLSGVTVNDESLCSPDAGRAGALSLWEQARAGLLTAVVARDALPARATLMGYERQINEINGRTERQTNNFVSGTTSRPFLALDAPPVLAARGYMEVTPVGERFEAPDADVLLDDTFAQTHCFGVKAADMSHAGAIGLTFEPVRGREGMVDVRGTVWIESGIPALRSMEFVYTDSRGVLARAGAGGDIQFHTMPNGVAFIESWTLSLPILERPEITSDKKIVIRGNPDVSHRRETGGVVLGASWRDGLSWKTSLRPVTGTIVEEGTNIPIAGVLIGLEADGSAFHTDSRGQFAMFPILPGRYMIQMADTTLAGFIMPRAKSVEISLFPGDSLDLHYELPGRGRAIEALCKGTTPSPVTGTILGRIVDSAGGAELPGNLRLDAEWSVDGAGRSGTRSVGVDRLGRFVVCGVPREETVQLTAMREGNPVRSLPVIVGAASEVSALVWPLDFQKRVTTVTAGRATLSGHVLRSDNDQPVAGADVWLRALDRHVTTDASGGFRFTGVSSGTLVVEISHGEHTPQQDTIMVGAMSETIRTYLLDPGPKLPAPVHPVTETAPAEYTTKNEGSHPWM